MVLSCDLIFLLLVGGRGHLDIQPHWVTALTWPQCKGVFGGCLGLSTDRLLVGRIDGSVAFVDILDSSTYRRQELEHCYRPDGKSVINHMSRVMRKPAFCICKNKGVDQLHGNHAADQRLCFRSIDSTITLLPKSKISRL